MFIDIACTQEKKYNQNTFGDYYISKRYPETGRVIAVLSDGLGSGVKANILACMTATMLLRFIEAESNIKKSCEIIMNSLPECQVRKISYSTFSAIDYNENGETKIIEEGNPQFIWIRNGKVLEPDYEIITSKKFPNRHMHIYNIQLQCGDRLFFCTDGVTQSGLGRKDMRFGLQRDGLIDIIQKNLQENSKISSIDFSRYIVNVAKRIETEGKAKDDISAVSMYCRMPKKSMIFTGPPYYQNKDKFYAEAFFNFKGKKAICGGTTAKLISRELNIPIEIKLSKNVGQLPDISYMNGIDLVTEGVLTLTKACEYLYENTNFPDDAAGKLVRFMLDSDCISFMVGAKLNQVHYDPNLPVEIEIRKNIIKKIADVLENKYMKKIVVQYM